MGNVGVAYVSYSMKVTRCDWTRQCKLPSFAKVCSFSFILSSSLLISLRSSLIFSGKIIFLHLHTKTTPTIVKIVFIATTFSAFLTLSAVTPVYGKQSWIKISAWVFCDYMESTLARRSWRIIHCCAVHNYFWPCMSSRYKNYAPSTRKFCIKHLVKK